MTIHIGLQKFQMHGTIWYVAIVLACVNIPMDYKLGLIWYQHTFKGLLFLNILSILH